MAPKPKPEPYNRSPKTLQLLKLIVPRSDNGDWRAQALCAQTDPESYFPEKGGSTRAAKKVCQECDVRTECLTEALLNEERFGIWGGLSERERRKFKKVSISKS